MTAQEEEEEQPTFEVAMVVPKRNVKKEEEDGSCDCVKVLVKELKNAGFIVEIIPGLSDEFIKLAAPMKSLGKAATELHMRKPTYIGMELQFDWEDVKAFVRQPDGSLFSWCERFQCYNHLLYGVVGHLPYIQSLAFVLRRGFSVNRSKLYETLNFEDREFLWEPGESLLHALESEGIVKQVFPLHDEIKRKKLLRSWVLNWKDFTNQPIDDMYSYFGLKIALYFAFLRMYTRWILFPALLGLIVQLVNFGSLQFLVLPAFFVCITLWAVLFFQFWKRKNAALLARWPITFSASTGQGYRSMGKKWSSLHSPLNLVACLGIDKTKEKEAYQRHEWLGHLMRLRNNGLIILSIICLQLPFELAYAHLYEVINSTVVKFGLTAIYLVAIQYFTKIGGKISVKLAESEHNENVEYQANSLVYKVFGVYFMQSYIGVFYHALLHRNFETLRQVLIQRLIVYQVLENLLENSVPFFKYSYKKYRAVRNKKRRESGVSMRKIQFNSKVEKESLKPTYSASVAEQLEDGLFDDFLQLALQFGMIMMFACAFPLAFALAAVNCLTEIRTDALKLLATMKRPVPRTAATIGAWSNIFQFLIVMAICTNSALLVCLYDQEGKWKLEPGLAAILIMEHILLLIKFGFSRFVPEEPAWVRANRVKNATQAQDVCSKQLLRTISGGERTFGLKKNE